MATPPDTAVLSEDLGLSEGQVAEYLRRHPDFLVNHPELLRVLTPPSRSGGSNVADMQVFMIERLRAAIARLTAHQDAFVALSRRTRSQQGQVHAAVIAMLGATTLEHLIEVVTVDFLRLLHVDVATLCVEQGAGEQPCTRAGVCCLEPGTIDEVLGPDRDILLSAETAGDERIFGAGAGLVHSAALVRLRLGRGAPPCLLALGSRHKGSFQPNQGAELLGFLARALEHCLRAWLNLPA